MAGAQRRFQWADCARIIDRPEQSGEEGWGEVDRARAGYVVAYFFYTEKCFFLNSRRLDFFKKKTTTWSERKEDFNGRTVPES